MCLIIRAEGNRVCSRLWTIELHPKVITMGTNCEIGHCFNAELAMIHPRKGFPRLVACETVRLPDVQSFRAWRFTASRMETRATGEWPD